MFIKMLLFYFYFAIMFDEINITFLFMNYVHAALSCVDETSFTLFPQDWSLFVKADEFWTALIDMEQR